MWTARKTRAVHFLIWDTNDIGIKSHCLRRGDFSYFINVAIKEWLAHDVAWEQPPQPIPAPPPLVESDSRHIWEEGHVSDR